MKNEDGIFCGEIEAIQRDGDIDEIKMLRQKLINVSDERDGFRNGQEQMQFINSGLIDSNNRLAREITELRNDYDRIMDLYNEIQAKNSFLEHPVVP